MSPFRTKFKKTLIVAKTQHEMPKSDFFVIISSIL